MTNKKERMRFLYNETAHHYDKRYTDIQGKKYVSIMEKLQIEGNILDVGGGTGLFSRMMTNIVDVLDLSFELLRLGMKRVKTGNWIAGDGENLPFRNNSFQTIVSFSALQNFPDRDKGISEIKRVLAKKGRFALTVLGKTMSRVDLFAMLQKQNLSFEEVEIPIEDIGVIGQK